jgi:hypothetical protein
VFFAFSRVSRQKSRSASAAVPAGLKTINYKGGADWQLRFQVQFFFRNKNRLFLENKK